MSKIFSTSKFSARMNHMVHMNKVVDIENLIVYFSSLLDDRASVRSFSQAREQMILLRFEGAPAVPLVPHAVVTLEEALKYRGPSALFVVRKVMSALERDHWASAGVNFIDRAGNLLIKGRGVYLSVEGKKLPLNFSSHEGEKNRPGAKPVEISRAFSVGGLKVLFVLLVKPDALNWTVIKIAQAARVSVGTVSATLRALEAGGYLTFIGRERRLHRRRELQRRWVEHYISTLKPSLKTRLVTGLDPQEWRKEVVTGRVPGAVLGGENALSLKTGEIAPLETLFYGSPPWKDITVAYRLRASASGNTELREIFWEQDILTPDGIAPDLLVYADALESGDSRQVEIAQKLVGRDG